MQEKRKSTILIGILICLIIIAHTKAASPLYNYLRTE